MDKGEGRYLTFLFIKGLFIVDDLKEVTHLQQYALQVMYNEELKWRGKHKAIMTI